MLFPAFSVDCGGMVVISPNLNLPVVDTVRLSYILLYFRFENLALMLAPSLTVQNFEILSSNTPGSLSP